MTSTGTSAADETTSTPLATLGTLSTGASARMRPLIAASAAPVAASSRQSVSLKVGMKRWQKYWMLEAPWTSAIHTSAVMSAGEGRAPPLMSDASIVALIGLRARDHVWRFSTPAATSSTG